MPTVKINNELYKDISEFCKLNSISIVDYVNEKLKNSLLLDKYGDIPFGTIPHIEVKDGPLVAEKILTIEEITGQKPAETTENEKQDLTTNKIDTKTHKKRRL